MMMSHRPRTREGMMLVQRVLTGTKSTPSSRPISPGQIDVEAAESGGLRPLAFIGRAKLAFAQARACPGPSRTAGIPPRNRPSGCPGRERRSGWSSGPDPCPEHGSLRRTQGPSSRISGQTGKRLNIVLPASLPRGCIHGRRIRLGLVRAERWSNRPSSRSTSPGATGQQKKLNGRYAIVATPRVAAW